ncbi:MAG: hypothetical protein KAW12_15365 [Candidatus Aminicenantes bacterium]|nr:hypothetical protein [Candidatus Aminicenantes bacterium]
MSDKLSKKTKHGQFNSVQLNLVIFVDVHKAIASKSLEGSVYMMDNSLDSEGRGTAHLETTCKQGQTLNWIIYPMDMDRRLDGSWPPMVKINNIVFLSEDGEEVADHKVCSDLKIFGGPDKIRSKETPVYYYWAGTVLWDLPIGLYKYRLILELDSNDPEARYMNLDTPSLNVIPV